MLRSTKTTQKERKATTKTKCANCGEEMIEAYTRVGLRLYICPHVKTNVVKGRSGVVRQGGIYCALDVNGLRHSFETLTKNTEVTLDSLRRATKNTISDAQLLESANLAIMLELPIDELPDLFEASTKLGYALGLPTNKAIEALCKGVGRRSRLILDNIGIAFKAQEAYDWYASENNLERLEEAQRTEAWQKYAIKLIKEKAKVLA